MRKWTIAFLLGTHAVLVGWSGWYSYPSKTEVCHMVATGYWRYTFRFDVFRVNPPLTRMIAGLPVLLCRPDYDWRGYSSRPQDRCECDLATAFVAANSPEKTQWCFRLARLSLIPLLVCGGYFGYRLGREVYDDAAGLLFLTLWCFSPLLVCWGATNCPDATAAALGIVAVCTFRGWLRRPNWPRAATSGACLGLLPLTKLTWSLAFALWPLIWCLWTAPGCWRKDDADSLSRPPLRQLAVIVLLGLYVLNMGYLFDGTCRPLGEYAFISRFLRGREALESQQTPAAGNRFAGTLLGAIPVPLPADFVRGIDVQRYDFERGLPSYLRGKWSDRGWWYYYVYALTIKEPIGKWCLVALAIGTTIFGRGYNASWRDEMVVLVPGLVILIFVSSQTGFSHHSRYVLPALPFFLVWTSKIARVFSMRPLTRKRLALAIMVVVALTWSVSSSLWAYPHSLSYFNELAGGPRHGGEHLLNSNIDWGQDLFYLKKWLDEHSEVKLDGLAYYGSYPATLAGILETPSPPTGPNVDDAPQNEGGSINQCGPKPGWYALSVNYLYDRSRQYRYFLDHFTPVASAGYSIYIYHITPDEANRVRRELGLPEVTAKDVAVGPVGPISKTAGG